MRRLVPLVACYLGGCLYFGDRNHPPVGTIDLPGTVDRCGQLQLTASASDPEGEPVSYSWSVQVSSDEPGIAGSFDLLTANPSADCPARDPMVGLQEARAERSPFALGSASVLDLFNIPVRGTYRVDLRLRDSLGAESWTSATFKVGDVSPSISALHVDPDPDPTARGYVVPDLTGKFPAHGAYLAWIEKIDDKDDDARCGNAQNKQHWEPVGRTLEDFAYWEEPVCDALKVPYGGVRFALRPELATEDGELRVRVTVTDGLGGEDSHEVGLPVAANRPPCILSTEPYTSALVKLPVAQDNVFSVDAVSDDVPRLMEFTWSVQDDGAPSFSTLARKTSSSLSTSYTLPAWFRSPGQRLLLRVSVREVGGPEPTCDVDKLLCPSDELGEECGRWVTWSVEFQ